MEMCCFLYPSSHRPKPEPSALAYISGAPALANALRNNDATPEPFQCTGESKGERMMDDNGKDHWK